MTPAQRELLDNANAVILGLQRAIAEEEAGMYKRIEQEMDKLTLVFNRATT